jgi:HAD superfamily hydrolase (TIGR01509 family)
VAKTAPWRVRAVILDVDGVLLASPHEQAWREALAGLADAARFTPQLYQDQVAGKPRAEGALAALTALGVPDATARAPAYAARKQARLEALIQAGAVQPFADGVRFVERAAAAGLPLALASASRNADALLALCKRADGGPLRDLFAVNLNGRDEGPGKPDPWIVRQAAAELHVPAPDCLVVEDAPAGVQAARAAGAPALGVARGEDAASLRAAGAVRVVASLDEIDAADLASGRWAEAAS